MQNPFTTTFSKIPDNTYISTNQFDEIIRNFSYDNPSESVYKITGVRGSGKTVLLSKIEKEMKEDFFVQKGWLVCSLSPARDLLQQLAAFLCKEGFVKEKKNQKSVNFSATIMGTGGSIGTSSSEQDKFFDIGVEIAAIIEKMKNKGRKLLICIDEVSKTADMVIFASEFGKWLIEGYPVHMVCTGLYENIEQLSNVRNLTFFRRATTIKTEPLNFVRISEMYRNKLGVDLDTAKMLAGMTGGYAYAFQELGIICFKNKTKDFNDCEYELKTELYAYAYEKIWEEMSDGDREFVRILTEKDEYKKEEVIKQMSKPQNYPVYRDRLERRGIIGTRRGFIRLLLPYFGEYVKEYGTE